MSREIKFRAWDKEAKEYYYDAEYIYDFQCSSRGCNAESFGEILEYPERYEVEQYTGLKDKNGKEIYEGDIVKMTCRVAKDESTLYKVVWDDFLTGYDLINLERSKADVGYLTKYNIKKHFEVIGNIHENPELLKGDEE